MEEVRPGNLKIPKSLIVEEVKVTNNDESSYNPGGAEGEIQESGAVLKQEMIRNLRDSNETETEVDLGRVKREVEEILLKDAMIREGGAGYKRESTFLYKQNETEYPEGSRERRRVLKAKKSQRFHEKKKGRIADLEEENRLLREELSDLRGKLVEAVTTCEECESKIGWEILEEDVPRGKSWEEGPIEKVTAVKKEVTLEGVKMEMDLEAIKKELEEASSSAEVPMAVSKPRLGRPNGSSKEKQNLENTLPPELEGLGLLATLALELENNQTRVGHEDVSSNTAPAFMTPSPAVLSGGLPAADNYKIMSSTDGVMRIQDLSKLASQTTSQQTATPPPLKGFVNITDLASPAMFQRK